ncbi:transcriptional regulator, MarR family [Ferroglobus placidus DSM 10642]|uniref:Transcriptional regulator, MarR family n=1 Tax=Ferroglobus placidus (strain DSM 10642 / AEDII12DO) TaxID=589924 RepID=D3RZI5_FERPA|nr:MarR family transcriptional regulator [Ferroglobus placidus]ADC65898.1 transcriptional regulator, MarR family [Ferroglobus placidus DSM 10642]
MSKLATLKNLLLLLGIVLLLVSFFNPIVANPYPNTCFGAFYGFNSYFFFAAVIILVLAVVLSEEKSEIVESGSKLAEKNQNGKILDLIRNLLEEDEFKIIKLVLENEGITQDSLHFKTGFSQSKISMIIKKLEEKNLIVREKFGKTYKIYTSPWLRNMLEEGNVDYQKDFEKLKNWCEED